jgi:hypothetical protein
MGGLGVSTPHAVHPTQDLRAIMDAKRATRTDRVHTAPFRWINILKIPQSVPCILGLLSHATGSADAAITAPVTNDIMQQFCIDYLDIIALAEQVRYIDANYCGQLYQMLSIVLFRAGYIQTSQDVLAFAIGQHRNTLQAMLDRLSPQVRVCITPRQLFS